jgi:hypothetical protein
MNALNSAMPDVFSGLSPREGRSWVRGPDSMPGVAGQRLPGTHWEL